MTAVCLLYCWKTSCCSCYDALLVLFRLLSLFFRIIPDPLTKLFTFLFYFWRWYVEEAHFMRKFILTDYRLHFSRSVRTQHEHYANSHSFRYHNFWNVLKILIYFWYQKKDSHPKGERAEEKRRDTRHIATSWCPKKLQH